MRIVSLLPSITEAVAALGAEDELVGVTHECDYPASVRGKTVVTSSPLSEPELSSSQIDTRVQERFEQETSLYTLRAEVLAELRPDVVFTQRLCDVCAVSYSQVERVISQLKPVPRLISLEPTRLGEMLSDLRTIGSALDRTDQAEVLIAKLNQRIEQVKQQAAQAKTRPRTFCLEWLEPIFVSGQWMPELVELAGGTWYGPGLGEPSHMMSWERVREFDPEVLVILPCGFEIPRTLQEMQLLTERPGWSNLSAVRKGRVYVTDGNAYFNRPGPRLVESLEILAELLHPEMFAGLAPTESFQSWLQ
ncbi:cobalamin-binding protein [Leptolyngbya sp. FACHB-261]|nr:cobalamin-binding protein [Leptolyngbya sp. FACHB-261]